MALEENNKTEKEHLIKNYLDRCSSYFFRVFILFRYQVMNYLKKNFIKTIVFFIIVSILSVAAEPIIFKAFDLLVRFGYNIRINQCERDNNNYLKEQKEKELENYKKIIKGNYFLFRNNEELSSVKLVDSTTSVEDRVKNFFELFDNIVYKALEKVAYSGKNKPLLSILKYWLEKTDDILKKLRLSPDQISLFDYSSVVLDSFVCHYIGSFPVSNLGDLLNTLSYDQRIGAQNLLSLFKTSFPSLFNNIDIDKPFSDFKNFYNYLSFLVKSEGKIDNQKKAIFSKAKKIFCVLYFQDTVENWDKNETLECVPMYSRNFLLALLKGGVNLVLNNEWQIISSCFSLNEESSGKTKKRISFSSFILPFFGGSYLKRFMIAGFREWFSFDLLKNIFYLSFVIINSWLAISLLVSPLIESFNLNEKQGEDQIIILSLPGLSNTRTEIYLSKLLAFIFYNFVFFLLAFFYPALVTLMFSKWNFGIGSFVSLFLAGSLASIISGFYFYNVWTFAFKRINKNLFRTILMLSTSVLPIIVTLINFFNSDTHTWWTYWPAVSILKLSENIPIVFFLLSIPISGFLLYKKSKEDISSLSSN